MDRTLVDAFLTQARRRPHATALVHDRAEISYGRLLRLATAHRALLGRPAEHPVAVPAAKTPGTVALVLACLLERRPFLLASPQLGAAVREQLHARAGVSGTVEPLADAPESDPYPPAPPRPDGTGFILTTSGSTGVPKAVPLGHRAVDRFVAWAGPRFGIGPGTAVLNYAPLNFDLCLLDVWTTLAHGGRAVLVDPDRATRGGYLLDLIDRHRVEVVQAVPLCFQLLADAARARGGHRLPSVRHALTTGDVLPAPLLAALPAFLPAARLHNLYGCTETNDSFLYEIDPATATHPLPLGRPLPGVHTLLVAEDGTVVHGPGRGELHVSTPFQAGRYLGPGAPAGFAPHPGGEAGRSYFRSGDLVRRDADGVHHLEGRTDFQVKVRGVRVNPQEVETVLLDHPQVQEAAVVALPDPVAGRLLHAVVRAEAAAGLNSLVLRGHLAPRLARAAIPSTLRVVPEALPRTTTGKVDRACVTRRYFGADAGRPTSGVR
ncbi:AMP-binding protein [Streptomyces sp. S186]|uniref:AMP-binding protein n=1 Tax=Streptomyces sp. S186 TaxID=3434395 RepID=UPI003F67F700